MTRYLFGELELNTDQNVIIKNDGEVFEVKPRIRDLLEFFLLNIDKPVSKQDVIDLLWQDVAVTDSSIYQIINELRNILNDDTKEPRYIKNIPRFGYKWIGPSGEMIDGPGLKNDAYVPKAKPPREITNVVVNQSQHFSLKKYRKRLLFLMSGALVILLAYLSKSLISRAYETPNLEAPTLRIACLPFRNDTGDDSNKWLELGMMDALSSQLSLDKDIDCVSSQRILELLEYKKIKASVLSDNQVKHIRNALGRVTIISASIERIQTNYSVEISFYFINTIPITKEFKCVSVDGIREKTLELCQLMLKGTQTDLEFSNRFVDAAFIQGRAALLGGEFDKALSYFQICRETMPESAEIKLNIARSLLGLLNIRQGEKLLVEVLSQLKDEPDKPLESLALQVLARVKLTQKNYAEFERHYQQAINIAREYKDFESYINMNILFGLRAHDYGNNELAKQLAEQVLQEVKGKDLLFYETDALFLLGRIYLREKKLNEAYPLFKRAIEKLQKLGGKNKEILGLFYLSSLGKHGANRDPKFKELFDKAVRVTTENLNKKFAKETTIHEIQAHYALQTKNYEEAFKHFLKLKEIYVKTTNTTKLINTSYKLMMIQINLGQLQAAEKFFNETLKLINDSDSEFAFIRLHYYWGYALYAHNHFKKAENVLMQGLKLSLENNTKIFELAIRPFLASLYTRLGKWDMASANIQVINELAELTSQHSEKIKAKNLQIELAIAKKNFTRAKEIMDQIDTDQIDAQSPLKAELMILELEVALHEHEMKNANQLAQEIQSEIDRLELYDSSTHHEFLIQMSQLEKISSGPKKAIQNLQALLRQDLLPWYQCLAHYHLAQIFFDEGDFVSSERHINKAMDAGLEDYQVHYLAGQIAYGQHKRAQALESLNISRDLANQAWTKEMEEFRLNMVNR